VTGHHVKAASPEAAFSIYTLPASPRLHHRTETPGISPLLILFFDLSAFVSLVRLFVIVDVHQSGQLIRFRRSK
jgi:hypothetical protein